MALAMHRVWIAHHQLITAMWPAPGLRSGVVEALTTSMGVAIVAARAGMPSTLADPGPKKPHTYSDSLETRQSIMLR